MNAVVIDRVHRDFFDSVSFVLKAYSKGKVEKENLGVMIKDNTIFATDGFRLHMVSDMPFSKQENGIYQVMKKNRQSIVLQFIKHYDNKNDWRINHLLKCADLVKNNKGNNSIDINISSSDDNNLSGEYTKLAKWIKEDWILSIMFFKDLAHSYGTYKVYQNDWRLYFENGNKSAVVCLIKDVEYGEY